MKTEGRISLVYLHFLSPRSNALLFVSPPIWKLRLYFVGLDWPTILLILLFLFSLLEKTFLVCWPSSAHWTNNLSFATHRLDNSKRWTWTEKKVVLNVLLSSRENKIARTIGNMQSLLRFTEYNQTKTYFSTWQL